MRKGFSVASALVLIAVLLVSVGNFDRADAAKRAAPARKNGSFNYTYASMNCMDFINPTGNPRVPTATCPELASTVVGTELAQYAEISPLSGHGPGYGQAVAEASFVLEDTKLATNSLVPVSVTASISKAEVSGAALPQPGIAAVVATLWISDCMATVNDAEYAEAVIATTAQGGPQRAENLELKLTAYCRTSSEVQSHHVFFDVFSFAVLNHGCIEHERIFMGWCGFVPGTGPLHAAVKGSVGSVTVG